MHHFVLAGKRLAFLQAFDTNVLFLLTSSPACAAYVTIFLLNS